MPLHPSAPRPPGAVRPASPAQALDALLEDPTALHRVRTMSSVSLHRMVNAVGKPDATELLALASPGQVRELLDLDVWQGDRLDLAEALDWLHLITTLPDDVRERDLRALDIELVGLVLLRHLRIHLAEEEDEEEEPEGLVYRSPDGWFVLEVVADDATTAERVVELVDRLYRIDADNARRLLQDLMWEVPTELEEWSYRWRNGRLQDLGFADPEQALLIYAYLDPGSVHPQERSADRTLASDPEPTGSELVQATPQLDSYLNRALAALEPEERHRLHIALVALGNRCLSADRVAPADLDGAAESLERLHWRLSLGLEFLSQGEPSLAPPVLSGVALLRVARVGHSLTLDLRRRIVGAARRGGLGRGAGRVDLLDPPLRGQITALLASRPEFREAATAASRPFKTLQDLAEAEAWIARALAVVELVQGLPLPSPLPERVTYGDLFRTALVDHLLGRQGIAAVDLAALQRFLAAFVVEGRLLPAVREAAHRSVPVRGDFAEIVKLWVDGLEEAVAHLDPHAIDLRFVDGLWYQR